MTAFYPYISGSSQYQKDNLSTQEQFSPLLLLQKLYKDLA